MRPRLILPTLVVGALLVTGYTLTAAGAPTSPTTSTTSTTAVPNPDAVPAPRREFDLDPQKYIDEYPEAVYEDVAVAAPASTRNPSGGEVAISGGGVQPPPPQPQPQPQPWPEPGEDNVFVDHGDSVWVTTATDAESTFGLDVDTGSFRTAVAQFDAGLCPEPGVIRVEEWVNAFRYGDQPATDDIGLVVDSGPALHATDGTRLVRVGVTTRTLGDADRPAAHITFVIDTSGSMDIRSRLGTVQASLALLVQHLSDGDTLAIVEYGSEARVLLEPTPVEETSTIVGVIDELRSEGSTNMEAGLALGYDLARESFDPAALNVVVLASDGVANVGSTDADVLTQNITRAGEQGIHLVTVGYGMGNYNDHLMEQLANMGDGFYSYVDTLAEARRLFVADLTPTLTVVAQDAKAQARFDKDVVESYRLIGYENRALDDEKFDDATVDAGELGAGHQVSALYEVKLREGVVPGTPIGEVAVRWKDGGGAAKETTSPLTFGGQQLTTATTLAAVVAAAGEVIRANAEMAARGITLDTLLGDAEALRAQNVNGADELVALLRSASVQCAVLRR